VIVAVVFVGLLCLLDLVLTFGVIRRLRQHIELLTRQMMSGVPTREALPVGSSPEHLEVTATDGRTVTSEGLAGRTLVGFFSSDCSSCHEQLPSFVEGAAALAGNGHQVLAVVVDDAADATSMVSTLEAVARVVVEPVDGPVATAFQARAFPSICLLDEQGMIAAAGFHISQLPVAVPAAV
jgi:thiol-disulfide isomerase/thioredoxin